MKRIARTATAATFIVLGALPWREAAAQASPVTPEMRLAAHLAFHARACDVDKGIRDGFDWRAVAFLEAREGREVAAGADGDYRAAAAAKLYSPYKTEGLCRQFGCVSGVVEFAAASPAPDCSSFVPQFLGMRINKPGWRPQDGLQ